MVACIRRNGRGRWTVSFYRPEEGRAVFCCRLECTTAEVELCVTPRTTEGFWSQPLPAPTGQTSDND